MAVGAKTFASTLTPEPLWPVRSHVRLQLLSLLLSPSVVSAPLLRLPLLLYKWLGRLIASPKLQCCTQMVLPTCLGGIQVLCFLTVFIVSISCVCVAPTSWVGNVGPKADQLHETQYQATPLRSTHGAQHDLKKELQTKTSASRLHAPHESISDKQKTTHRPDPILAKRHEILNDALRRRALQPRTNSATRLQPIKEDEALEVRQRDEGEDREKWWTRFIRDPGSQFDEMVHRRIGRGGPHSQQYEQWLLGHSELWQDNQDPVKRREVYMRWLHRHGHSKSMYEFDHELLQEVKRAESNYDQWREEVRRKQLAPWIIPDITDRNRRVTILSSTDLTQAQFDDKMNRFHIKPLHGPAHLHTRQGKRPNDPDTSDTEATSHFRGQHAHMLQGTSAAHGHEAELATQQSQPIPGRSPGRAKKPGNAKDRPNGSPSRATDKLPSPFSRSTSRQDQPAADFSSPQLSIEPTNPGLSPQPSVHSGGRASRPQRPAKPRTNQPQQKTSQGQDKSDQDTQVSLHSDKRTNSDQSGGSNPKRAKSDSELAPIVQLD